MGNQIAKFHTRPAPKIPLLNTSTVFSRHLWYLSEVLVPLSFFDEEIPVGQKRDMMAPMNWREGSANSPKRISASSLSNPMDTTLPDLFSKTSSSFFQIMSLETGFLSNDPEHWSGGSDYEASKAVVLALRVTNDVPECSVTLDGGFHQVAGSERGGKTVCPPGRGATSAAEPSLLK